MPSAITFCQKFANVCHTLCENYHQDVIILLTFNVGDFPLRGLFRFSGEV